MEHKVTPRRTYFFVFLALLILLGATVGVAFLDLGIFNPIAAVSIATLKALLVLLFFMHIRYSDKLTRVFVIAGLLWLLILIGLTLSDYLSRLWIPTIGR